MKKWSPHSYHKTGLSKGFSASRLAFLKQRIETIQKGLPVILTLKHLSLIVGMSYKYIYSLIINRTGCVSRRIYCRQSPYRSFRIRKKTPANHPERYRIIYVPSVRLCAIQRWIHKNILSLLPSSCYSYAFDKNKSIKDCAEKHVGCNWLIKVDVQNFFESITEDQVYFEFKKMGYAPLLSYELASLCTKERESPPYSKWTKYHYERVRTWNKIAQYQRTRKRFLPQGAPTSPLLSNLVMTQFDMKMGEIAQQEGLVYTRYADDLYLSTINKNFNRKKALSIIKQIYDLLRAFKFKPNYAKTKISSPRAKKIVLGLVVESNGVFLQKKFKNNLEVNYHFFVKDPHMHVKNKRYKSIFSAYNHIKGLFSFAKQIEPNFCDRLIKKNNGKLLEDVLIEQTSI